jgi:predicted porin
MGDWKAMSAKSILGRKTNSRWSKVLLSSVASVGFVTGASAADLDTIFTKGAPPVMPDLTWQGMTLIGNIDLGGQYESHGVPNNGIMISPQDMALPSNGGPKYLLSQNNIAPTFLGIKVDRVINDNFDFIARFESGFNPQSGNLINGPRALQLNNGVPLAQQTSNGDSSRAGQIFNGEAYFGLDAHQYGRFQVGRNNNVSVDMFSAYDQNISGAFSLPGWHGSNLGQGSTETIKLDDSIKYLNQIGQFRTELIYGAPGTDTKQMYQGSLGWVIPQASIDVYAGQSKDSVSLSALSAPANLGSTFLGAKVYDTTGYGIFGKYVFDLSGSGYKDRSGKLTVGVGWDRVDYSNPSDGGFLPGHATVGGYIIGPVLSTNGSAASGVLNYAYTGGDRLLDTYFITAKYQVNTQWSVIGGLYRLTQNYFGSGVNALPGVIAPGYSSVSCSTNAFSNCMGSENVVSMRVDYDWTKNLKLYFAVAYSKVDGGLAAGYQHTDEWDPTLGMSFHF